MTIAVGSILGALLLWRYCCTTRDSTNLPNDWQQTALLEEPLLSIVPEPLRPIAVLDMGRGLVTDLVLIGQGAFGSVWRGRYNNMDVAVKKAHVPDVGAQMAQMDEIRLVAALPPHPNVLPLLGAYLEDATVCNVSPFMSGGSLEQRMRLDTAWLADPGRVTDTVCGLFDGLSHLHRHGVLHRDLAPRNALFDELGRPVLCDFGLSRMTQDGVKGLHNMTQGLNIPIRWMAPEVLSARSQYFYASDVWSMGVVVWQLLTRNAQPYPDVPDMMAVVFGYARGRGGVCSSVPLCVAHC